MSSSAPAPRSEPARTPDRTSAEGLAGVRIDWLYPDRLGQPRERVPQISRGFHSIVKLPLDVVGCDARRSLAREALDPTNEEVAGFVASKLSSHPGEASIQPAQASHRKRKRTR